MTIAEAKTLKAGDRVLWHLGRGDTGRVLETGDKTVVIKFTLDEGESYVSTDDVWFFSKVSLDKR